MENTNDRRSVRGWIADNFTLSFCYPFLGIWYFLRNRYMWGLLGRRLVPLTLLSLFVVALLFITIYLPQVAVLMLFHGGASAWVNGTFLVLGEANLVIAVLFEAFLVDKTQVDSFDAVLVAKGYADLVRARRPVSEEGVSPRQKLGAREKGATFAPFSFRQIFEFVVLLPLNLIPYAGVPLFLLLTGYRAGPLLQYRYFELKGFTKRERRAFTRTKSMRWQYMWFGTVYLITQLVPVLSMFFLITGAAGSALWVVDMEDRQQRGRTGGAAPQQHDYEDAPPAYTDEP